MGVKDLRVVYDGREDIDAGMFPKGVPLSRRAGTRRVRAELAKVQGDVVVISDFARRAADAARTSSRSGQTRLHQYRRLQLQRSLRGAVQLRVIYRWSRLGRKRAIDQRSSCNKTLAALELCRPLSD
jgi:indolepyruvate ferredoxin oxidoreductase